MNLSVSLRTRLALLYAGLAVIVLGISLFTVYEVTRRDAQNRVDSSLRNDAKTLGVRAEGAENGSERESSERFVNARDAVASGHMLGLIDDQKVFASSDVAKRLFAEAKTRGMLDGGTNTATIELPEGSFRTAVVPVDTGEFALAAAPLAPVTESEEGLLHATIIAGAIGIALTSVGAWFAARRGLRPLESITELADEVAPDALGLRTGLENRDEIGAVAAAIDRMLARLETAFDTQKRFLEDASHELRTPLTIARGHLELLEANPSATPEERDEALSVAISEIDRMARLVDGLLQLARASEVERLTIAAVAVEPLLESIAAQLRPVHERTWLVTADPGVAVQADEDALRQIILNLARNADEHSPTHEPIELSATRRGEVVEIDILDRGAGVDRALRDRAFDRFVHDGQGIGLGLAISQTLAETQHGTVSLGDRPDGGAVAKVTLPSAFSRAAARARPDASES